MESMHPFDRAADECRPVRYYEWQDEFGLFSAPLAGFIYEPDAEDPRVFRIARRMTDAEVAAQQEEARIERREREKSARAARQGGPAVRTALYRLCGHDERLLYVGISEAPLRRWPEHAGDKAWWPEVANFSLEWFESRPAAHAAEVAAIRTEAPKYNVAHKPAGH
ncbi:GIY-YIG nuclease family protein [Streptomyces lavendulae]|uniref:GIY-YIG nuclease family protein n=1 Tax=Streptomyces lavendulae TaxID=1914 RepID=UPI0031E8C377